VPYEWVLYQHNKSAPTPYLELPHVLSMYYEAAFQLEVEAAKLAELNREIAARYEREHA